MSKRISGRVVLVLCAAVVSLVLIVITGCPAPVTTPPTPVPSPKPAATPAAAPAAPQVIKWERWQDNYTVGPALERWDITGSGQFAVRYIQWVKEATNGRLIITRHEPGALISAAESFKAAASGMIDAVGETYGAYYAGTVPEANVEMGMPFAWENHWEAYYAFYRMGMIEEFRKVFAQHNVFYFPTFLNEPYYHFGTTFPVRSIDDLKGKKIRAGGIYGDYVQALGGSPVNIPAAEIYMGLKLGTIDGVIFGAGSIPDFKLDEVLKYYVVWPNTSVIVPSFLINLDKWNALPQDIKTILLRDTPYVIQGIGSDYILQSQLKMADMIKAGKIQPIYWSDKDTAKARDIAINTLWPKVAAMTPNNARLVNMVVQQAKLFGKIK